MEKLYTFILVLCSVLLLNAQNDPIPEQVSVGGSYINATFYHLEDGATTSIEHPDWDIAFDMGQFSAGVIMNEGVARSSTNPFPEPSLYLTTSTDFATADTAGMTIIYNDEVTWESGAFNQVADPNDLADIGWGTYGGGGGVTGSRVFVIQLRSGVYKKLFFESLDGGVYTFKYANLDGSDEVTATVDKADYPGKSLAYYSIENDTELDAEPAEWDLLFTRYKADVGTGTPDYNVTGVLSNAGVSVAQADGIDPSTIASSFTDFEDDYVDSIAAIGWDWKSFTNGSWNIVGERVYFVKTADEKIWMITFSNFQGSFSGVTTLTRQLMEESSSTNNLDKYLSTFKVFPNPATDVTNIVFDSKTYNEEAIIQIINPLGQTVFEQQIDMDYGLNARSVPLDFPSGLYHVTMRIGNDFATTPLFIK
ncbi:MAG: T9SS type A sorting domain-containing protein [Bacteroidota bacterium]